MRRRLLLSTVALCTLFAASTGPLDPMRSAGAEDEEIHVARARRVALDVQPAIVRIQWRARGGDGRTIERHAVVIDPEGWLLLAGPRPSPDGTLAAIFDDGRAMRAEVWASDAETCLTLLRVPVTRLPPLSLRESEEGAREETGGKETASASTPPAPAGEKPAPTKHDPLRPTRWPIGMPFVMVTAGGPRGQRPAVARGRIRANHRRRVVKDPSSGAVRVTCLDEAALAVLPTDLGAPWLDRNGRIVGLLVGADVGSPDDMGDVHIRPEVTAAYAVPADVIRIVWPLLKIHREVPRVALGAYVARLSDATREHVCPGCEGFQILDLAPNGPAQLAKLEVQDIIRTIGGHKMATGADLSDVLLPYRPGQRLQLGIVRRGKPHEREVVLGRAR